MSMATDYTSPTFILASSSPRRAALLRLLVPAFSVIPPDVPEDAVRGPADLLVLAERKAAAVAERHPEAWVVAADTGVFREGRAFGKPRDLGEAREFLRALSGGWHTVATGLVVRRAGQSFRELVETRVLFRPLADWEIEWYLGREEVLDKAGAYAIQGPAAAFVERIEGDFYNVVGLPLCALWRLLLAAGWRP